MSVDKLRGSYHVNRVSPNEIGLLLSAQSYRPAVTKAINKIKEGEWRTLQSLISNVISPGPHPKYDGDYPCLKTKNVQDLIAETSPADWADISEINDLSKVQVGKGDLLINLTGAGSIGRVSVYYGDDLPITNQHIAKMSPSNLIDEGYLVAYLRSFYAKRALEQGVAGSTGQINMVNDHVRCTPVRICHSSAQKYIGDKVRQAECLRAWANGTMSDITLYFDSLFPQVTYETSYASIKSSALSDRLDSVFYQKHYLELDEFFDDCGEQVSLLSSFVENSISGPAIPSEEFGDSGVAVLQTKDIKENLVDIEGCGKISAKLALEYERFEVSENHILMGMSGTIGRSALIYNDKNKYIINQRVAGLSINNDDIAGYLCAYLNHEFGKQQLQRRSVGGVQANIGLSEILATRVLIKDEIEAISISSKYVVALTAIEFARQLTKTAKLLVEDLIEGQLTESQLVSAQQAQEAGDDSLDRALLERMTSEGIDGEGDPLFDDIDQLYDLLEQAKQALDTDDTMVEA